MIKYNGWTNRDTWLTTLWLNNDERNYRMIKEHFNLLVGAGRIMLQSTFESGIWNFGDKINFSKVNYSEVLEVIKEIGTDS